MMSGRLVNRDKTRYRKQIITVFIIHYIAIAENYIYFKFIRNKNTNNLSSYQNI